MAKEASEPKAWAAATDDARAARENVAEQLGDLLIRLDMTGSADLLAARLTSVTLARRSGDRDVLRAAVMDLTVASAAWLVALDLDGPRGR